MAKITLRIVVLIFLSFWLSAPAAWAASISSVRSGNWSSPSTWGGSHVPGDGDDVTIVNGHVVVIDQNVGTAQGGLLMLRVGTTEGSTAQLKFDGASASQGYKIVFASTGKTEGQNAFGIDFWGMVDLEGTTAHPLTIEPRVQDGSAYTFIHKNANSAQVRLTLKALLLRFLGDENNNAGVDARGANKAGDQAVISQNTFDHSGPLQLWGADGAVATVAVSGNIATDHRGSFVQFRGGRNLKIDQNQVTLVAFGASDTGQAIIDSIQGDKVGGQIIVEGNTLVSAIDAELSTSPHVFGIWMFGYSDVAVRGNCISAAGVTFGYQEGIYIFGGAGEALRQTIEQNKVANSIHGIGIHTGLTDNPGVDVSRNWVFNNRNEHIFVSDGYQTRITGNVLYGFMSPSQAGILLYNTDQAQIINNTLDGFQPDGLGVVAKVHGIAIGNKGVGTATNVTISNNILTHWGEAIQNRDSGNSFKEVGHNLFFGNIKDQDDFATTAATQLPAAQAGNVSADPEFVNGTGRDYHILSGSPAIDAGSPIDAPALDMDNQVRPTGKGFDIGADEFLLLSSAPLMAPSLAPILAPCCCASTSPGGGGTGGGGNGGGSTPPPASSGSSSSGFGCGILPSRPFNRADGGDLLLLAFPFAYLLYKKSRRGSQK